MQRIDTKLPGVFIIEPKVFGDDRGFFMETYHAEKYRDLGIDNVFVQDNHSRSARGTLRGLHFQLRYPQTKLCRVVSGEVLDVAVDIRHGSPHFGKWVSVILSAENKRQIYIPTGFAHGILVLSESADLLYKCDDFYHADDEGGVIWNDPDLGIPWNIEAPLLSNKDTKSRRLREIPPEELPVF